MKLHPTRLLTGYSLKMATVEVDSLSDASRPVVEPDAAAAAGPGHDDAEAHGGPEEDARSNKSSELQDMVEEQEQTMKTMQREIKRLTDMVMALTTKMLEIKVENKSEETKTDIYENDERITKLKSYNHKDSPTPEKYNMEPKEYEDWVELFPNMMSPVDGSWEKILVKAQAKKSERPWGKQKVEKLAKN